jgi:hypothetical protein
MRLRPHANDDQSTFGNGESRHILGELELLSVEGEAVGRTLELKLDAFLKPEEIDKRPPL